MFLLQQCFADSKHLHKYETIELLVQQQFDITKILAQLEQAKTHVYSIRLLTNDRTPLSLSKLISNVDIDLAFFNVCKLSTEIGSLQNTIVYVTIVNDLPHRALDNLELRETLTHICERLPFDSETYLLIENNNTLWEKLKLPPFTRNTHVHCSKSLNLSHYPLEQISGALTLSFMCSDFSGTIYLPPSYIATFKSIAPVKEGDIAAIVQNTSAYKRKECFQ